METESYNSQQFKILLKMSVHCELLSEHAIKKELKEIYSIVRKGHKIKSE